MVKYNLLIIGAGAAGITTAIAAVKSGITGICIVERENEIGGVLKQCIHSGFGMGYFGREMTGVEYAEQLEKMLADANAEGDAIELRSGTIVNKLTSDKCAFLSSHGRYEKVGFKKLVLATGCRETTIQSHAVAGTRPDGVYTAGEAQKMRNVLGRDVGNEIVILGTGDIGQIMARHYLDEGKTVVAMVELSDKPGGLERNRRDIIEKYNIPVILRSTVVELFGDERISAVKIRNSYTAEERILKCDTLITAMGLIPERDILLSLGMGDVLAEKKQLPDWLYLCGNCDYVHDIVDSVSIQAEKLVSEILK